MGGPCGLIAWIQKLTVFHRETIKRVLSLPPDTRIEWKSHDDSIAQRTVLDQQRQEKAQERRRTLAEESKQEKASS